MTVIKTQMNVFIAGFLVVLLAGMGIFFILNYNGLVKAEKGVEEAAAQIEAVCQRRLDLIPNLIETVKAYARHEQETLTAVTAARAQAMNALAGLKDAKGGLSAAQITDLEASQKQVVTAMRGLFAIIENYPDLRASSNFLALQDQFEGTENRIAVARQRYNSAVRYLNSKVETFPGVFLAPMFGFEESDFFQAEPAAMKGIKAQF